MNRRILPGHLAWRPRFCYTPTRQLSQVNRVWTAPASVDLDSFRSEAFVPEKALLFPRNSTSLIGDTVAASRWFTRTPEHKIDDAPGDDDAAAASSALSSHLEDYMDWSFPFELVLTQSSKDHSTLIAFRDWLFQSKDFRNQILAGIIQSAAEESGNRAFLQLHAPLRLLQSALQFNNEHGSGQTPPLMLYIAQSSLSDLPPALQADLPTPDLVRQAGKGDVYSSSLWLGTEPTYTPLHRDPNPNLFCQLCSSKTVRLLPPAAGDRVFFEVQVQLRQHSSSRIRGTDMMEGKEREVLHEAIWVANEAVTDHMQEAQLNPGDALFIPKGWWHSVKSSHSQGHLNGSVNWWFR